jgi:hypothetical protein
VLDTVMLTVVDALFVSVIVAVHEPVSAPDCTVNVALPPGAEGVSDAVVRPPENWATYAFEPGL